MYQVLNCINLYCDFLVKKTLSVIFSVEDWSEVTVAFYTADREYAAFCKITLVN